MGLLRRLFRWRWRKLGCYFLMGHAPSESAWYPQFFLPGKIRCLRCGALLKQGVTRRGEFMSDEGITVTWEKVRWVEVSTVEQVADALMEDGE